MLVLGLGPVNSTIVTAQLRRRYGCVTAAWSGDSIAPSRRPTLRRFLHVCGIKELPWSVLCLVQ